MCRFTQCGTLARLKWAGIITRPVWSLSYLNLFGEIISTLASSHLFLFFQISLQGGGYFPVL